MECPLQTTPVSVEIPVIASFSRLLCTTKGRVLKFKEQFILLNKRIEVYKFKIQFDQSKAFNKCFSQSTLAGTVRALLKYLGLSQETASISP
jgi:hypothetical protein